MEKHSDCNSSSWQGWRALAHRDTFKSCFAVIATLLCVISTPAEPILQGYHDYEAHQQKVFDLAKRSQLVQARALAQSAGGRDVFLITLSTAEKPEANPAYLIVGGVDAPHLVGSEIALGMASAIVDRAEKDQNYKKWLEQNTVYIIPRANPDAAEAFFRNPYYERRGNDTPTDDDRDAATNEDDVDDLNKDGVITMMRVKDSTGNMIPHPADPRVMIPADPNQQENGEWLLLPEGLDNDKDEEFNEDGVGGVDFNRQFPFQYPYFQPGAGVHMAVTDVVRAVIDFAYDHDNIVGVLSFTPEDNLFRPWKPSPRKGKIVTQLDGGDAQYTNHLAEVYRELHGGKQPPASPDGQGSFSEWVYFHYGRPSLAARAWWIPQVKDEQAKPEPKEGEQKKDENNKEEKPADKKAKDNRAADQLNSLRYFEKNNRKGFVDWKPVEHPDFPGKVVEVGGFKPFVLLNPPAEEINGLVDKHLQYLDKWSAMAPKLTFSETKVEDLGEGVSRLTVKVENQGVLPTMLKMCHLTRASTNLQIELKLPEKVTLLTSHPRQSLSPLAGSGGMFERVWLIRNNTGQPTDLNIRVFSPMVHDIEATVKLK